MGARTRSKSNGMQWRQRVTRDGLLGSGILAGGVLCLATMTFNAHDPSWNVAGNEKTTNLLGGTGATLADFALQILGLAIIPALAALIGFCLLALIRGPGGVVRLKLRAWLGGLGVVMFAAALAGLPHAPGWPMRTGLGGLVGDWILNLLAMPFAGAQSGQGFGAVIAFAVAVVCAVVALQLKRSDFDAALDAAAYGWASLRVGVDEVTARFGHAKPTRKKAAAPVRKRPVPSADERGLDPMDVASIAARFAPGEAKASAARDSWREPEVHRTAYEAPGYPAQDIPIELPKSPKQSQRAGREAQGVLPMYPAGPDFELPRLDLLAKPKPRIAHHDEAGLKQNARLLMTVLSDFGVKGEILNVRPGPVVTLYELEPAAGVKSARVIGLADDVARSMSVQACRIAVVPGRNAIGIELPNARRETVYLRDLLSTQDYESGRQELPLALGETIGGEPSVADLARMPHLLIAGTTGSGKSVGINAMILSLLYKMTPQQCRFIMIDPKMLELSVYDGIPHLLAPVVTDPKKAVAALKWAVREMEDRYRKMSKIGVRNIGGYNQRAAEAQAKNETFSRTMQTGWDRETGKPIYETETFELTHMPYIVVVIDEMADLMLVAGKDIEGAVQRLAQMARAAGIHLIMATQRPSVDVITGTIKANFPTRISYSVTSKIDSRTILGEQGAEQLLGQGDLLYMAQGGKMRRLHGPFVSDKEVEEIVASLKAQGAPEYFDEITAEADDDNPYADGGEFEPGGSSGNDLFDRAVAIVARDRKASTSYLQRRLSLGYNRAASLIERMEQEGMISPPNHAGKREILLPDHG
ncbi:DNA translocase FtsK [Candidatus Phycosocius bacilliformis]|uniref:DNA translocase FtsK n=1 Tax=Candidatus Phycosocius bacilliformis TaxID=1445552 RepID=A0A2P2E6A0_9PROT|nr:DNA translocase FtsK 4TM domain-containing protein [Candidatus Phycosocius bacilliformis]GBF56580.1 DNA translocase FtsK [Candidatus Phycosocius bacilliformis]